MLEAEKHSFDPVPASGHHRVRAYYYSSWGDKVQDAQEYLANLPTKDLSRRIARPGDPELLRMARLDCDWDGANLRAFASMKNPRIEFLPARMIGNWGFLDLYNFVPPPDEMSWLILIGQYPGNLADQIGKLLGKIRANGFRIFYWAYDEASRTMPCFASSVAPYLSVLIHDESPLSPEVAAALDSRCHCIHRGPAANLLPFEYPFEEQVENKIVFLGSKIGLSKPRARQLEFLRDRFKDAFVPITDHSIGMEERGKFARYKVHLCPEGQHFTTFGMRLTHTDRPFWAGGVGEVPVIEDSTWGGRLDEHLKEGLVYRYAHGDLASLAEACEAALQCPAAQRRRIYQHCNSCETIGVVAASTIAERESGRLGRL